MTIKKYKKFCFLFFLGFVFLLFGCFFAQKIYALEVKYPTISGDINLNTAGDVPLPDYVKYLFDLGMFIGFFSVFASITMSGIGYLISFVYPGSAVMGWARDRFSGAITGLVILTTVYLIIITINPQLSILAWGDLPPIPPAPQQTPAGIYFYKTSDCTGENRVDTTNIPDLGAFKNKVNSVSVLHNPDTGEYYVGLLYNNLNFEGKCVYLLPKEDCQSTPSASGVSASVHTYNFSPNDDGVYFYRKSYFDDKGGYVKIPNDNIKKAGVYEKKLDGLKFISDINSPPCIADPDSCCTVPKDEQDCAEYKDDGSCSKRTCPTLDGGNTSSIYIHGNYIVVMVYAGYQDPDITTEGPWTYCQEFPTDDDINRTGPIQIKWQPVRKDLSGLPNAVLIIPVKR